MKKNNYLPLLPNSEESGEPNPSNTKIYLSNFEYNLLNKHVEYSDQHMGAVHPSLCNKDVKFMKIGWQRFAELLTTKNFTKFIK